DDVFLAGVFLREPGVSDTLAALQQRYVLGLLSNHVARWAYALLERFALRPYFAAVVISSKVRARKPDLITYERICQLLSIAPERAVYIADEEEDLVGCQAAGMFPIFVPGEDAHSRVGLPIARLSDLLVFL
ncbi:MAG: HAD family hydrolase, partial [Chloroflexi bacterium]|nr:HAD family hydrolase [Chloroflexota bacterium]